MITKVIGGEFDINIQETLHNKPDFAGEYLYSSGRAALYNILLHINTEGIYNRILLPDYLCSSVLEAIEKFDFTVVFYNIKENLLPDLEDLGNKLDKYSVVLLINYFGCINCSEAIEYIKGINNNIPIIQDNVQALFDMYNNSRADYIFTSFRKTLAAPDGAWVKTNHSGLPTAHHNNTFAEYKIAGALLKYAAVNTQADISEKLYLDLFKEGEYKISDNYKAAPSNISLSIINGFDREKVASIRKSNAKIIIDGVKAMNVNIVTDIQYNHVPLFIPIRLTNRDKIRKALFENNIYCPVHWPVPNNYTMPRGKELAANELSLIIDQRYNNNDMFRILDIIQKNI